VVLEENESYSSMESLPIEGDEDSSSLDDEAKVFKNSIENKNNRRESTMKFFPQAMTATLSPISPNSNIGGMLASIESKNLGYKGVLTPPIQRGCSVPNVFST
jgi:hypothetical protein